MATRKRLFDSLSEISSAETGAEIHVALATLSPMKQAASGISYFDGIVTDGDHNMRLVGFDSKQQPKLEQLADDRQGVKISNCNIKKSRLNTDEFEVHLNCTTLKMGE